MLVIAARYRVPTADFAEADARVRAEQDPLKEQAPGFIAEARLVEGIEGDTIRLVIIARWRDRAATDDYFAREAATPGWSLFRHLAPDPPASLFRGEAVEYLTGEAD